MAITIGTQVRNKSTGKSLWVNAIDPKKGFQCGPTYKSPAGDWLSADQFDVLPNGPMQFTF